MHNQKSSQLGVVSKLYISRLEIYFQLDGTKNNWNEIFSLLLFGCTNQGNNPNGEKMFQI